MRVPSLKVVLDVRRLFSLESITSYWFPDLMVSAVSTSCVIMTCCESRVD